MLYKYNHMGNAPSIPVFDQAAADIRAATEKANKIKADAEAAAAKAEAAAKAAAAKLAADKIAADAAAKAVAEKLAADKAAADKAAAEAIVKAVAEKLAADKAAAEKAAADKAAADKAAAEKAAAEAAEAKAAADKAAAKAAADKAAADKAAAEAAAAAAKAADKAAAEAAAKAAAEAAAKAAADKAAADKAAAEAAAAAAKAADKAAAEAAAKAADEAAAEAAAAAVEATGSTPYNLNNYVPFNSSPPPTSPAVDYSTISPRNANTSQSQFRPGSASVVTPSSSASSGTTSGTTSGGSRTTPSQPLPSCPAGYTFDMSNIGIFGNEKTCYQEGIASCPAGQTDDNKGNCVGPDGTFRSNKCSYPYEYHLGTNKCRLTKMPECPTGYTRYTTSGGIDTCTNDPSILYPYATPASGPSNTNGSQAQVNSSGNTNTNQMNGSVFGPNGPFSGQAGTGQHTAMNASANLTGSRYGNSHVQGLDAYNLWTGTKGNPNAAGSAAGGFGGPSKGPKVDAVRGPAWGGMDQSGAGQSMAQGKINTANLYGPLGYGDSGKTIKKNSQDTSMLPDFKNTGSDLSNLFAATSRVPGKLQSIVDTNLQASSYSLANYSQKTDPVPYLPDFSVFRN